MTDAENKETSELAWQKIQDALSEENGVAIAIVEGEDSTVISVSNNNSICRTLQASEEFASLCEPFCGQAFTVGLEKGKPACFHCHAGLAYATVPIEPEPGKKLVAIVGRVFSKGVNYLAATEKMRSGDWQKLPTGELLENILLTTSLKEVESVSRRLQELSDEEKLALLKVERLAQLKTPEKAHVKAQAKATEEPDISVIIPERIIGVEDRPEDPSDDILQMPEKPAIVRPADRIVRIEKETKPPVKETSSVKLVINQAAIMGARKHDDPDEVAAWRSLFNSLLDLNYHKACVSVLKFLSVKYELNALAWLEKKDRNLETYLVSGSFRGQQLRINLPVADPRLTEAIHHETALELFERTGKDPAEKTVSRILLFPIVIGGELRSALVVGDEIKQESKKRSLARFCRQVSVSLEILRLRDEIERQALLSKAVRKFNEGLSKLDSEEFWSYVAQVSAELLQAEYGSLLIYDEDEKTLMAKAAVGKDVAVLNQDRGTVGHRIAARVLQQGKPLVVTDVNNTGMSPAPAERKYKTRSFLSYPIVIGSRKIGVLNVTDKVDGSAYNEYDLQLLDAVTPQLAVALDRVKLERKAGKYEQLSITDPLTGLLNRRYLEERLDEEIKRTRRYGYAMSFMMIDVDEFKSYNDTYLHTAGDKVLQALARHMKNSLRGADVAARYGGEEFSILLPQTALPEAKAIAERLREEIATAEFPNRKITISIGVATFSPNIKTAEELISAADKALYEAKHQGRNNVQIYQSLPVLTGSTTNVSEAN
ncbi:MAG TPA: diguanylate cyclase [Pyrinomonadaceae bacterium]|jgi:diguanylate cyclase (GGDEF)-like protein|nr:diguanylate cyclase [Pyrinomonadaceae bacterium]